MIEPPSPRSLLVLALALSTGLGPAAAAARESPPPAGNVPHAEAHPPGTSGQEAASEEQERRLLEAARLLEEPGVLTRRGSLVLEPTFDYSHSSVNRVEIEGFAVFPAIVVGSIDVTRVRRDTYVAGLALRYGVARRTELALRVPYVAREDRTTTRPFNQASRSDTTTVARGSGLGDVEASLHRQLNRGGGERPYFVANLRVKSDTGRGPHEVPLNPQTGLAKELPTGSGFWSVQPSLSAILPSDPAVFFGNVSYLWTAGRWTKRPFGTVDPGDGVGLALGMGVALNERTSFSLGYEQTVIGRTTHAGGSAGDPLNVAVLQVGASYRVGERLRVHVALGAGLTVDAPDLQLSLRVPVSF